MNLTKNEVRIAISKYLNAEKAPGYNLIIGRILKELPELGIIYFTQLFNAILRTGFFSAQWKVTQIVMIPKPSKHPIDVKLVQTNQLISHHVKATRKNTSPETNAYDSRKEVNT
jgi:hypothetical protein